MRGSDDPVGACIQCATGPGLYQIGNVARLDHSGVQIVPVQRRQNCHCENFGARPRGTLHRGAHHMGVAVNSQEIQIKLRKAPYRGFDGRADVKKFHIQKDAFAMLLDELICQRHAAACQHSQPDFVKAHRVAKFVRELKAGNSMGNIKGDDQAVI